MLSPELEMQLSQIEHQCEVLAQAVNCGDPVSLQSTGAALRQAAVDLTGLVDTLRQQVQSDPSLKMRLKQVAQGLAIQREGLIRRMAVVERALHAMVPATREATYGASSSGIFSGGVRQSGAFKVLAA